MTSSRGKKGRDGDRRAPDPGGHSLLFAIVCYLSPVNTHAAEGLVATIRTAMLTGDWARAEAVSERLKDVGPAAVPFASELLRDWDSRVRAAGGELVQELVEEIRERNEDGYTKAPSITGATSMAPPRSRR